jgi:hypothetical protein
MPFSKEVFPLKKDDGKNAFSS